MFLRLTSVEFYLKCITTPQILILISETPTFSALYRIHKIFIVQKKAFLENLKSPFDHRQETPSKIKPLLKTIFGRFEVLSVYLHDCPNVAELRITTCTLAVTLKRSRIIKIWQNVLRLRLSHLWTECVVLQACNPNCSDGIGLIHSSTRCPASQHSLVVLTSCALVLKLVF